MSGLRSTSALETNRFKVDCTDLYLPGVLLAGGAGSALRHPRPRLQEQRCQHHEAVVREGTVRVQPERLYVRFLYFQPWESRQDDSE